MGKGLKKEDSAALKGMAVLIMIILHCYRLEERLDTYGVIFRGVTKQQVLDFIPYGKVCVSVFAFVSGFGLMYSWMKNRQAERGMPDSKWAADHLIKTMAGYWFISFSAYFISALRGQNFEAWGKNGSERISSVLVDLLGFSELFETKSLNGTWWYMTAAVVYIIVVPVLASIIMKYGGLVCTGILILVPRTLGIECQGGNAALTFLFVMVLGMLCCKYDFFERFSRFQVTKNVYVSHIIKFSVLLLLVVFGKWSFERVNRARYYEYAFGIIPFFLILFSVEYLFKIKFLSKALQFMGKHSMNIWLTHTFVRDWMKEFVYRDREFWMIPIIVTVISLLISIAINFVKKISRYDALMGLILKKLK